MHCNSLTGFLPSFRILLTSMLLLVGFFFFSQPYFLHCSVVHLYTNCDGIVDDLIRIRLHLMDVAISVSL